LGNSGAVPGRFLAGRAKGTQHPFGLVTRETNHGNMATYQGRGKMGKIGLVMEVPNR
jgi:hypothetical protein